MNDLNIKIIEVGGSILILAVFIALLVIVGSLPELKTWSNILYVVLFLGYTAVMSLFGLKMAPYLSP
ncbi:MAG TPA: hypothetical protein VMC84_06910 [Methanocella sp.]|uniref:hypothetical protein n=1 Tax=Methanocella sp. TaxID=2052833 RepID=UPI002CC5F9F3|nr:hypothetical protein [Methanocella sp.]HTY90892.1 hypothetical protein [Methanocella sp.]